MSRYEFVGRNNERCTVISNDKFGEIRAVRDESGEMYYAGIDIAACMGFDAPTKAITRSRISGKLMRVPWVSGKRQGIADTRCFSRSEAEQFIQNGLLPPNGFKTWIEEEMKEDAKTVAVEPKRKNKQEIPTKRVNDSRDINSLCEKLDDIVLEILTLKKELLLSRNE